MTVHSEEPMPTSVDFTVEHDHGILVIEPLGSTADHAEWDVVAQGVHLESDSLYVAVLPSMEGAVTTSVRRASGPSDGREELDLAFEGRIRVASRHAACRGL